MTPMRITAEMGAQVVYDGDPIHFDGLLAGAVWNRMIGQGEAQPGEAPEGDTVPDDFELPLARWTAPLVGECHPSLLDDDARLWGWKASDVVWPDEFRECTWALRRMPSSGDFAEHTDADKWDDSTGILKPRDKTYPTRFATHLHWYAVGDPGEVRDLLSWVSHIGHLRNEGMGKVIDWTVEPIDDDRSLIHEGQLRRTLPASKVDSPEPRIRGTIRPPYWHSSRELTETYRTGTEVADG